jgi:hypothetical protein
LAFSTQTVGLIRTVVIVCPFLDAWIVKAVISHRSCATAMGEEKTSIGSTMFGPLARWHLDETVPQGAAKRSSLVEGSHCPMLGEPLQNSDRHEIKDFHGALLSSRPTSALLPRYARRFRGIRNQPPE